MGGGAGVTSDAEAGDMGQINSSFILNWNHWAMGR